MKAVELTPGMVLHPERRNQAGAKRVPVKSADGTVIGSALVWTDREGAVRIDALIDGTVLHGILATAPEPLTAYIDDEP